MFRKGEFRDYCFVCETKASAICPRCKRPACTTHAPTKTSRCSACEAEYYDEPGRLTDTEGQGKLVGGLLTGVSIPVVGTLALIGLVPVAIGVAAGTGALLGGLLFRSARRRRQRTRFLRQGLADERKLLGSGADSEE